jgi:Ca2+-binding EF-hand superfamily protein
MLDLEEFKSGYSKYYGITMDEKYLETVFNSVDVDRSGEIDFTEFLEMNHTVTKAPSLEILHEYFYTIGGNSDIKEMAVQDIEPILVFALVLDKTQIKRTFRQKENDETLTFDYFKQKIEEGVKNRLFFLRQRGRSKKGSRELIVILEKTLKGKVKDLKEMTEKSKFDEEVIHFEDEFMRKN